MACHSLGLEIFMPSISLFFSLKFMMMLHSGTESKYLMLATSRVAAEGPTMELHVYTKKYSCFPAWMGMDEMT